MTPGLPRLTRPSISFLALQGGRENSECGPRPPIHPGDEARTDFHGPGRQAKLYGIEGVSG